MKASFLTKETVLDYKVQDRKFPKFKVGDTVKVAQKVKEGGKERIQMYQGDVIAIHNNGIASTFTVRRIGANGVGVERIFPYHTPMIKDISLVKRGVVRRAKLYYLRDLVGKATKIKEKITTKKQGLNTEGIEDIVAPEVVEITESGKE
ncbi:MAG: 50S ribosomal protein L19 [bacterium]